MAKRSVVWIIEERVADGAKWRPLGGYCAIRKAVADDYAWALRGSGDVVRVARYVRDESSVAPKRKGVKS